MPYNSNIEVVFKGLQGGKICESQLEYHAEDAVSASYAANAAQEFLDTYWTALQSLVSEHFTLLQLTVRTTDTFVGGGISESYTIDVNEAGSVVGQVMPPNVTARIRKVVDNTTIEPVGADPFKNGFVGFSGVPEAQQDNGLLNSTAVGDWQVFAELLEEFSMVIVATPYTWTLGLERGELNPPKVLVSSCQVSQRLGTRNSRKR